MTTGKHNRLKEPYRTWVKTAERTPGWRVRWVKRGKAVCILYPPDGGRPHPIHSSPARYSAEKNARSDLKRRGLPMEDDR